MKCCMMHATITMEGRFDTIDQAIEAVTSTIKKLTGDGYVIRETHMNPSRDKDFMYLVTVVANTR